MENINATNGREGFLRTARSGDRGVAVLRRQNGDNAVRKKIRADVALMFGIGIIYARCPPVEQRMHPLWEASCPGNE